MAGLRALVRRADMTVLAERAVLVAVMGIAATASYLHLQEVWIYAAAPIPTFGPLIVDGLFAAAWLRMRRRRRESEPVGWLAWLALAVSLGATVAGNLSAAWIGGARDTLSLTVAASPAIAFALVWELATGHAGPTTQPRTDDGPGGDLDAGTAADAVDQGVTDELLPTVQGLTDELGRRPTRQAVRDLTGVGAGRADRLRNAATVRPGPVLARPGGGQPA